MKSNTKHNAYYIGEEAPEVGEVWLNPFPYVAYENEYVQRIQGGINRTQTGGKRAWICRVRTVRSERKSVVESGKEGNG